MLLGFKYFLLLSALAPSSLADLVKGINPHLGLPLFLSNLFNGPSRADSSDPGLRPIPALFSPGDPQPGVLQAAARELEVIKSLVLSRPPSLVESPSLLRLLERISVIAVLDSRTSLVRLAVSSASEVADLSCCFPQHGLSAPLSMLSGVFSAWNRSVSVSPTKAALLPTALETTRALVDQFFQQLAPGWSLSL